MPSQSELRLTRLSDERAVTQQLHESVLGAAESREKKELTESESTQVQMYREKVASLDTEMTELVAAIEADARASEASKQIQKALISREKGVELDADGEGIVYRDFYTYGRDMVLTRELAGTSRLAREFASEQEIEAMRQRQQMLKRVPANTLSSDTAGLQPQQHIAQIFQVIDASRPLVASGNRVALIRGSFTFPKITQRPLVAVQSAEKTEAGNQKMIVTMNTATASTYLGGGDISWQAINWSTPDALRLWFDLAAEQYAIQTEQDAGEIIQSAAANHLIANQLAGTTGDTFANWITAVTEGAGLVYTNSRRMANTVYLSPDMFYLAAALTSAAGAQLLNAGSLNVGSQTGTLAGMRVVVSAGLDAGVAIVGYSDALLVAETPGAPVELRVVEPAIGGVEVGIIGAFEAVAADDNQFALIGTGS
jgi:hypothetical protein